MKVIIFKKSDNDRGLEEADLVGRLKDRGLNVEVLDTDEPDGSSLAEVYDVFSTPSVLVTMDNGTIVSSWIGQIPPENDIINASEV